MICSLRFPQNSNFFVKNLNQPQLFHNFVHYNSIPTSNFFSRKYHVHFQRNFSIISEIRTKGDIGDSQSMFEYGSFLIDRNYDIDLGLAFLKRSADLGNTRAVAKYVSFLYEKIKKSEDTQTKKSFIPYLKKASSTNDPLFLRMYADICLQLPSFFKEGLSSLKVCADNGDKESAEYYGTLKLLSSNFRISNCVKYLQMSDSRRSKAIIEFFDKASEDAKLELQKMADKDDDIISSVICIFAELLTLGKTDRIDKVYRKLTKTGSDSISEPWKTVLLNSVGTICLGIGDLNNSYRFIEKAYENGSNDQLYFLSFLRFYKNDKICQREETFNLIKKAYEMQIDSDEYDITQKYAYMLLKGDGCSRNYKKAAEVLELKENKNMTDFLLLAVALFNVNRKVEAFEILKQTADDGDVDCQKFYAFYLMTDGKKDKKDVDEAKKYLELAVNSNDKEAIEMLKKLEKGEFLVQSDISLPDLTKQPTNWY